MEIILLGSHMRIFYLFLWIIWWCTLVGAPPTTNNNHTQTDTLCDQTPSIPALCGPEMCYHGICTEWTDPNTGLTNYACKCHSGWLRPGCEKCCDLSCLNNGNCTGTFTPKREHLLSCKCPKTHTGARCQEELCIKACVNGRCEFEAQEEGGGSVQVCRCKEGFDGDLCDLPDPGVLPDWYYPMVGIVVTLGVILIILGVVMPYVMWKQRALIILKILYYFKQYKDDESLRFDAFIACTSDTCGEDMDFLLEILCPVLEDVGYKVCYGERNFTPGRSLVDNTCVAIEQSRRTILLLSPDFMLDAWPTFQLQIAQHEALKSAHRIIPILFRDLGPVSNPTLRHILASLQCLKWPHEGTTKQTDRFWSKLKVLMPKLKENPEEKRPGQQIEFVLPF